MQVFRMDIGCDVEAGNARQLHSGYTAVGGLCHTASDPLINLCYTHTHTHDGHCHGYPPHHALYTVSQKLPSSQNAINILQ